jgi:hypothetical protein
MGFELEFRNVQKMADKTGCAGFLCFPANKGDMRSALFLAPMRPEATPIPQLLVTGA